MTAERSTHQLTGCAPVPLAHYLKALGILRLVAGQADPGAQGWWAGDVFLLRTMLDRDGLRDFFVDHYPPTPVVAPWNGGSGFYPKDNQASLLAISEGHAARVSLYRETIAACRSLLFALGQNEKSEGDGKKELLIACRSRLPDEAVAWLDAAFVMTSAVGDHTSRRFLNGAKRLHFFQR